jgi:hypothetical protein
MAMIRQIGRNLIGMTGFMFESYKRTQIKKHRDRATGATNIQLASKPDSGRCKKKFPPE